MVSDKNRRYSKDDLSCAGTRRDADPEDVWFNEGDLPKGSKMTVEAAIGSALICFFACYCGHKGRFSPADMKRRKFDPRATMWSLTPGMRCRTCGRVGVIVRITRVRVPAAQPRDL